MESETLLTLNQDQWRTMDQIAEALSAATDLIEGLQTGLGLLLSALGRPGAALYLARCSGRLNGDWAFFNPPPAWPGILADTGVAARVEMDQAMRDGAVRSGKEDQGYAAIFPLVDDGQPLGALLVSGPVIPPEDYPAWQGLLRPFVRVLRAQIHLGDNPRGDPVYRELLRTRDTLRALFDNLPISIYIIDPEYTLAAINMSRADRTGEPPRQLVGRKCYQALYQRESPCAGCLIADTFASGQTSTRVNRDWLDSARFVEWEVAASRSSTNTTPSARPSWSNRTSPRNATWKPG
jgi:PAS domain-containing protein